MFFGKKEEAPANLQRMTVKKFPDQYPAEKFLQAEPVAGDTKDAAIVRPLLRQTELGETSATALNDSLVLPNYDLPFLTLN